MEYSAVIVAAGKGSRMKLGYNKIYYKLDGKTILEHTMKVFEDDRDCKKIIVVTDKEEFMERIGEMADPRILVVNGGSTRQLSVCNGLELCTQSVVFIHDGARPYVHKEQLEALKSAMENEQAACLMVPCKDTIKRVKDGYIVETIERSTLMAAQTPQVFQRDLIYTCMRKAMEDGYTGTDDCSLVERYSNAKIKVIEGSYENLKITTIEDLK